MAVAADSHRNFLIPAHTVLRYARQRMEVTIQMLCVYSFVTVIIAQFFAFRKIIFNFSSIDAEIFPLPQGLRCKKRAFVL